MFTFCLLFVHSIKVKIKGILIVLYNSLALWFSLPHAVSRHIVELTSFLLGNLEASEPCPFGFYGSLVTKSGLIKSLGMGLNSISSLSPLLPPPPSFLLLLLHSPSSRKSEFSNTRCVGWSPSLLLLFSSLLSCSPPSLFSSPLPPHGITSLPHKLSCYVNIVPSDFASCIF